MKYEAGSGTGRTTRQIQDAPQGATFIWCNRHLDYVPRLARHLGRSDLKIVGIDYANGRDRSAFFRSRPPAVEILDHAAPEALASARARRWWATKDRLARVHHR